MLNRLRFVYKKYPGQFWLLFVGLLISTIGSSMIWPFLMIYVSERLDQPLTVVAGLNSINAFMGLIFSFLAGPVTDKAGRKWVMVVSLIVNGLGYLLMSRAGTLPAFAMLMALIGAFNPLYRVGADAMMADLIPPEERADAYSLLRMSNNLGVALGPSIGGILATTSYTFAFYSAAAGLILYGVMMMILGKETLSGALQSAPREKERLGGYDRIFRDSRYISFVSVFTLTSVCSSMIWVLLAVYAKQNFGVKESLYGLIPTTNALMVVFLQYIVTQWTKKRAPMLMLALGALFYGLGVGNVGISQGFWGFWLSMVILTTGELILSPTATTTAANLAPADMRGRYMSLYGLTWNVALGIGPVLGGFLSDTFSPPVTWYGGLVIGLFSAIGFLLLSRRFSWEKIEPQLVKQP